MSDPDRTVSDVLATFVQRADPGLAGHLRTASRCTGTDCSGCDAARRHYKATGCLVPECTDPHAKGSRHE